MSRWRMKMMPLAEWAPLQEHFGNLQMASGGDPDLAMFMTGKAADRESAIYLTGPGIEAIERLSPGGWTDADTPSGEGITLLVGTADSWKRHGVTPPRS